ncbi:sensor histidine kinase [Zavarzinella formosa]|uniref:sensor histidine kinase n=1 Tax=Zavarzinella formosa TaxID=360055 RepID=UPI0002E04995|nr:ATP-binding protein [Zavarzinella formosa]
MSLKLYPRRLLFFTTLFSGLALAVCGTLAVSLAREQSHTADVLGENIGSRRAAANLEEAVRDLLALHQRKAKDVEAIHERVEQHLIEIEELADKTEERRLEELIAKSYQKYLDEWNRRPKTDDQREVLIRHLNEETLPVCQQLRNLNANLIEESEKDLRQSLRRMAWGLGGVGGLASVAGLVLGYGLARNLRRTIHRFLVHVQGASDLLGQELPPVEWQRDGERLDDGADDLLHRVGQVVQKLQQNEREIRRSERLAAVGQLAAGVAHEIRNPLMSAILLLETARRDPAAGGLSDEELVMIENELLRIESSLKTFLDFARPPKLERTRADLAAVVRDALALTRGRIDRQNVRVILSHPKNECFIDGDKDQLRQVILNLILNALDVMPHGGNLTIELTQPTFGRLILSVADSGSGISPEIQPRLFEPFATNKETGIGLGLVVSKRIVEDHGGRLTGVNGPAGGAVFTVELPSNVAA